jgi:hypothetical protein
VRRVVLRRPRRRRRRHLLGWRLANEQQVTEICGRRQRGHRGSTCRPRPRSGR